jgi:hypothetical protein
MASPPCYPTPTSPQLAGLMSDEITFKMHESAPASAVLLNASINLDYIKSEAVDVISTIEVKLEEEKLSVSEVPLDTEENEIKDVKQGTTVSPKVEENTLGVIFNAEVSMEDVKVAVDQQVAISPNVPKPLGTLSPATASPTPSASPKKATPSFGFFATNPTRAESSRSAANFSVVASASAPPAVDVTLASFPTDSSTPSILSPTLFPVHHDQALSPIYNSNTVRSPESNFTSPSNHSPRPRLQPLLDRKSSITSTSMSRGASDMSESASGNSTPRSASGSDVPVKKRAGRKPKAKIILSEPQLIGHLPIAEDQALRTFTELEFSTYANKSIGNLAYEEGFTACDCRYDANGHSSEQSCGDDAQCMNRLMQIECEEGECRCRNNCQNQR